MVLFVGYKEYLTRSKKVSPSSHDTVAGYIKIVILIIMMMMKILKTIIMVTLAILIDPNAFSLEFIIWFVSQGYKISS